MSFVGGENEKERRGNRKGRTGNENDSLPLTALISSRDILSSPPWACFLI
jgi:hypothetical protein